MQTERADATLGGVAARDARATRTVRRCSSSTTDDLDARDRPLRRRVRRGRGIDVAYAGKALLGHRARATVSPRRRSARRLLARRTPHGRTRRISGRAHRDPRLRQRPTPNSRGGRRDASPFDVIDNAEEIERLARARASRRAAVDVMLRINTGHRSAHARVRAYRRRKHEVRRSRATKSRERSSASPSCRNCGSSACTRTSARSCSSASRSLDNALRAARRVARARAAAGIELEELIVGGGIGIDDGLAAALDPAATLRALAGRLESACAKRGVPTAAGDRARPRDRRRAGTSLYRVLAVKRQGRRRFVIVDGGMADNPRPALYGAHHLPSLAGRGSAGRPRIFTLAGRSCENDELGEFELPGDLRDGRPDRAAHDRRLHLQHGEQLQPLRPAGGRLRGRRAPRDGGPPRARGRRSTRRCGDGRRTVGSRTLP